MRLSSSNASTLIPSSQSLSGEQIRLDHLAYNFSRQATQGQMLAAMAVGSLFYQVGRLGCLALGSQSARFASYGVGLTAETLAFEGSHRFLSTVAGDHSNTNLWRWNGVGGWREGLLSSATTLGVLKSLGFAGRHQNVFTQHLLADAGMVASHQAMSAFGLMPENQENIFAQMLQAEATQLQLGVGGRLTRTLFPGLSHLEHNFTSLNHIAEAHTKLPAARESFANLPQMAANDPKGPTEDPRTRVAYTLAGELVRDKLAQEDPAALEALQRVTPSDILVVDGNYDHLHRVLDSARLPYTRVDAGRVDDNMLQVAKVVFVNCGNSFPVDSARRIAQFVQRGGLAITTDWALRNVVEVGFPGYIRHNGQKTGDEVVTIEALNPQDPLLASFFSGPNIQPRWWLESSSYPIEVLRSDVEVLVRSSELGTRYGANPVIVRFPYGRGGLYHMISHFYLQRAEARTAKDREASVVYAANMGASGKTQGIFQRAQEEDPDLDTATVAAASSSVSFVARAVSQRVTQQGFAPSIPPKAPDAEAPTNLASPTGIFHMLSPEIPRPIAPVAAKPTISLEFNSPHFQWNAETGRHQYRFPRGVQPRIIGREGDDPISGDMSLSRRHAQIQRMVAPEGVAYHLTALSSTNPVIIHRTTGGTPSILRQNQRSWVNPGDLIQLTPNISFIFNPE